MAPGCKPDHSVTSNGTSSLTDCIVYKRTFPGVALEDSLHPRLLTIRPSVWETAIRGGRRGCHSIMVAQGSKHGTLKTLLPLRETL